MKLTKELASKVLTGLMTGDYEANADQPAEGDEALQGWVDVISETVNEGGENGAGLVTATAQFVHNQSDHVTADEFQDYLREHYRTADFTIGAALQEYASADEVGDLGKLYTELDKAGGVDYFDWLEFADSGSSYMKGIQLIVVPTTGIGVHSVYVFEEV